jgi:hypothetical protein
MSERFVVAVMMGLLGLMAVGLIGADVLIALRLV